MKLKSLFFLLFVAVLYQDCSTGANDDKPDGFYKQEMRLYVQGISQYSKTQNINFVVIPQNGVELVTIDGDETSTPATDYLNAIDAVGREDLFYGYNSDNIASPISESNYLINFLDICVQNNVTVLTTDYCWDHTKMDDSYTQNTDHGFISFAAPDRELNLIPDYPASPYNENSSDINSISDAKNFLYLINPGNFATKQEFISVVNATNYDVVIMDLFFDDISFTSDEIDQLKLKNNGGSRIIIAYMSIGEAEDYRYYWKDSWKVGSPGWIAKENPNWDGNYKVKYWNSDWQEIIFGNDASYLKKIVDSHFDGVYLDIIDAFEYFE